MVQNLLLTIKGARLLLYIREDKLSKCLLCKTYYDIETLIVKTNLEKKKVLFQWILQS